MNGFEKMIIRPEYVIENGLYDEALSYAEKSKRYTSNRHDFHAGGLNNKKQKMLEGKLGEKAVKILFNDNGVSYEEDKSSFDEPDQYDFLLISDNECLKVDVKTRTKSYHTRTLEMVEQAEKCPKDIFISARLYKDRNTIVLLGWYTYKDMVNRNKIQNNGYRDNYVMCDKDLRPIPELMNEVLIRFIKK